MAAVGTEAGNEGDTAPGDRPMPSALSMGHLPGYLGDLIKEGYTIYYFGCYLMATGRGSTGVDPYQGAIRR